MTEPIQYDLIESLRLRDDGITAASFGYGASEWLDKARATARYLAISDGECTIDDVLKLCPRPPYVAPNATGSVFKGKGWIKLGGVPTAKITGHGREIKRWALA